MKWRASSSGWCLALTLLGCAGPTVEIPESSVAELDQEFSQLGSEWLSDFLALRARVKDIEYALTTSAARHCGPLSRPRTGAVVESKGSLAGAALQALAESAHGIADAPSLVYVIPGGPAARAGLREGDLVEEIDGEALESPADFRLRLVAAGSRDSIPMRIARGDRTFELDVSLVPACPIFFEVSPDPSLVPWQWGKFVVRVPVGLLRFTDSDDVVAVAMAHELAHALFERTEDGPAAAEMRADRLGLMLAHEAGFDVRVAPAYWEEVAKEDPRLILPPRGRSIMPRHSDRIREFQERFMHLDIARRMPGIRTAVGELVPGRQADRLR